MPAVKAYVAGLAIIMINKIAITGKDRKIQDPTVPSGIRKGLWTGKSEK
jgi:hypothetical protein